MNIFSCEFEKEDKEPSSQVKIDDREPTSQVAGNQQAEEMDPKTQTSSTNKSLPKVDEEEVEPKTQTSYEEIEKDFKQRIVMSRLDSAYRKYHGIEAKVKKTKRGQELPQPTADEQQGSLLQTSSDQQLPPVQTQRSPKTQTKKPAVTELSVTELDLDFCSGDVGPNLAKVLEKASRRHQPLDLSVTTVPAQKNRPKDEICLEPTVESTVEVETADASVRVERMTFKEGGFYEGPVVKGVLVGEGIYRFPSGAEYRGHFAYSKRNGYGTHKATDGSYYEGTWLNNMHHGTGTMRYANGDGYVGQWCRDKKEGLGEYTWKNGMKYRGAYAHDVRHGRGKMTYSEFRFYEGSYIDDKKHGLGKMVTVKGKTVNTVVGRWEYDNFIAPPPPDCDCKCSIM